MRVVGAFAVVALTAVNYFGVQRSAWLTRLIVAFTLLTLAVVVIACLAGGQASGHHLTPFPGTGVRGVLQAGGLLFFAFAGYARIATLGEEVRDPARTIPRAVTSRVASSPSSVYAVVGVSALLAVGPVDSPRPQHRFALLSMPDGCTRSRRLYRLAAQSPRSGRFLP